MVAYSVKVRIDQCPDCGNFRQRDIWAAPSAEQARQLEANRDKIQVVRRTCPYCASGTVSFQSMEIASR